jgi:hypothetical protein
LIGATTGGRATIPDDGAAIRDVHGIGHGWFMQLLLNKGTHNGNQILKPETVAEMFKRSMVSKMGFSELPPISETTGFYYGLGVDSYDYAGRQVIEKAGALAGVRTVMTLVPDENGGIFVAANLNLTTFPEAVALRISYSTLTSRQTRRRFLALRRSQARCATFRADRPRQFFGTRESFVGSYENTTERCEILLMELRSGRMRPCVSRDVEALNSSAFVMQFPARRSTPSTFAIGADGGRSFTRGNGYMMRVQDRSEMVARL